MDKIGEVAELEKEAGVVRKDILNMIYNAGSGHPGGSLSCADILTVLYFNILNHDPQNPEWNERDKFILSKGHGCSALYSVLARTGYFNVDELNTFRKLHSRLQGHPDKLMLNCLEMSSGSLGQGLSVSIGMALASKLDNKNNKIYCLLGDGELNEGQVWEALMTAAHYKLNNLIAIVDNNGIQQTGFNKDIKDTSSLNEKFTAFKWKVFEIDGHNISELLRIFNEAIEFQKNNTQPVIIIAHTVKGKGVSFMENKFEWHGKAPNKEEYEKAMMELN